MGKDDINRDGKKKSWFARHKVLTVILGVIVLFFILGAIGGSSQSNTATTNTATPQKAATDQQTQAVSPSMSETQAQAVPAEYKSALAKAESYSNTFHMSKQGTYDQLVSEYGEKFTPAAAQYAIDNVKADWNANALAKAKSYQDQQHMSPSAIRDQLVSEYGEKFTAAEADYAIKNL